MPQNAPTTAGPGAAVDAASDPAAQAAPYLQAVAALTPELAAAGETIDRERRVPSALVEALQDAGLWRMLLPRSVGGAEVHPLAFLDVVEALAAVDASTAWNVGQTVVCAMVAAYMPPEAAQRIFGGGRTILAWGPPAGPVQAVANNGGYRVTGNWSFASGGRHATWLGAICPVLEPDGQPRRTPDGGPARRVMLFPAQEATWSDIWDVIGLRGTASDGYAVTDLEVPHAHSIVRENLSENREPGWLYCFTTMNLFECGFGTIALSVARAMLDAFVDLAMEKTPRGYRNPLRESAATQSDLGQAEARLRAARAFLRATVRELCAAAQATHEVTLEQRMTLRMAATHAIQEAVQVGDFAYESAGATAIFQGSPFERRFRDLHTIAQQLQGRKSHFQTVGQFLLGLEADTAFV